MSEINDHIKKICSASSVTIYGAGMMGRSLLKCLSQEPFNKKIDSFVVNDLSGNPSSINGIPVVDLKHVKYMKDELFLVALHEKYISKAINDLVKAGVTNMIPISFDCDLWCQIREDWMRAHEITEGISLEPLNKAEKKKFSLYVVHSFADRELKEKVIDKEYEISIQVGAALCDIHPYKVRDDYGDNISRKNKQYCELTALYWIWKNDTSDFVGLSHYRRRFELTEMEVEKITSATVDVVVTIPVVNFNTVRKQYELDHDIKDWEIMLEAIENIYPQYLDAAKAVQNGICYYAYNMFIARKEIFDNYCKWLFDILDYCEERIGKKDDVYQNRYAGFLAERLLTIFLVHNKQYKITVAEKHFIESI